MLVVVVKSTVAVLWTNCFLLEALDFMRLAEKWQQCVVQMETGEPVADHTGVRDVPYHRASGQSCLMGFCLGLL